MAHSIADVYSAGSPHPAGGLNEVLQLRWHLVVFDKATAQFVGDVLGDVAAPAFGGIEGDDAHRVAVLAANEIADQHLASGAHFVGLAPSAAKPSTEVVEHEISVLTGFSASVEGNWLATRDATYCYGLEANGGHHARQDGSGQSQNPNCLMMLKFLFIWIRNHCVQTIDLTGFIDIFPVRAFHTPHRARSTSLTDLQTSRRQPSQRAARD